MTRAEAFRALAQALEDLARARRDLSEEFVHTDDPVALGDERAAEKNARLAVDVAYASAVAASPSSAEALRVEARIVPFVECFALTALATSYRTIARFEGRGE